MQRQSAAAQRLALQVGGCPKGDGIDAAAAEQVAREIRAQGGEAIACIDSVATPEGGTDIINAAMERYG
jgi:hypothetical protein